MSKIEFLQKCGYQDGFEPKDFDPRINTLMDFLIDTDLNDRQIHTSADLQDIVNSTEAFYSKLFTSFHTVLTTKRNVPGLYNVLKGVDDYHDDFVIEVIEESPFLIPILVKRDHSFQASIKAQRIDVDLADTNFCPLCFLNIKLSKPFSMYSFVSYAHEICHSQIDSVFSSIKDYHNNEVLSIFLEKLRAFSLGPEVFRGVERRRLLFLGLAMKNFYDSYDNYDYTYYVSTIKAEKLFDIYMNSSLRDRKAILDYINQIMAGELSVEEMLDNLGITLDNSLNTRSMQRNLRL